MAQFTKYASSDAGGPGLLNATAGSLLAILDACLVNGYPGKTAAGWTKPFVNAANIGCYVQGGGSGYGLVINDDGSIATQLARNARATGWKSIAGIGSPVGSGTGQFPLPAQLLTDGHVVIRKSATADATGRTWVIYADNRQFMMFILSGDTPNVYTDFYFGDTFSLWGSADVDRCLIIGGNVEAVSGTPATTQGFIDRMFNPLTTAQHLGAFMADNSAGSSGSQIQYLTGDLSKSATLLTVSVPAAMQGAVPSPNPADNSYYLSPMWISDVSWAIRGRARGLYQLCHPVASFSDGQIFNGANDYAGKVFQIVKTGRGGGAYVIEISDTLDTN